MIHYAPNYIGLTEIRNLVGARTGNNGRGTDLLPMELLVCGNNFGGTIVLHVGPKTPILAGFLEAKLGVEVLPGESEPDLPWQNWIALHKSIRDSNKPACAKAIIMAYLACNNFIAWPQTHF